VLANSSFGSIISESGQSYTWIENAHEIRLTPWNNDPINDLNGEAFYLKDEESGRIWSPAPLPCKSTSAYITRHGFGYSVFEHIEDGVSTEMTVFVDIEEPVKYVIIKFKNNSGRSRSIEATGYLEWVLGDLRAKYSKHTVTLLDEVTGALMATNAYSSEFTNRVAFFDANGNNKTVTGDRAEFLGRNGTMANPDGLNRARLSGKTGAALDPCGVIQVNFNIAEDEEHEVIFRLGAGRDMHHAQQVVKASQGSAAAHEALQKVYEHWKNLLGVIQINTPDTALNMLTNGWLNYQTLASRIQARSGFYQSGGAFGFRDQLQDVLSLIHSQPNLVRSQIILCASRQFKEGDVQHWWHPPSGRGVRTTCSDDYLWLPYVTAKYVKATGDIEILDEQVSFIEGRLMNAGEESYYDLPIYSDVRAGVYEHCVKAIEHGLRMGEHGLPLIGSGDWNDGMDKVGVHGKGESVWLAFFLYDILMRFSDVAMIKKDKEFAKRCKEEATKLQKNIEEHTWDGEWYRRAYFDDGTPLGSKENDECKIDSIAQSWSVISKAGSKEHTMQAMRSAYDHLVQKDDNLIQLFNPPFDKSLLNPGYIKGYVPGVRENGGQYTHAAIWLIMAFAASGNRDTTWELLQMINPVNKGSDKSKIDIYKTEPYVIAADVYKEPRHRGRGGWTWYTGSAGWMYQLIINSFIGLKKEGDTLHFAPCLPHGWNFDLTYRFVDTPYHIQINQSAGDKTMEVFEGDKKLEDGIIPLVNDSQPHEIRVELFRDNLKI
jgi:cellobiose phosphorylase